VECNLIKKLWFSLNLIDGVPGPDVPSPCAEFEPDPSCLDEEEDSEPDTREPTESLLREL